MWSLSQIFNTSGTSVAIARLASLSICCPMSPVPLFCYHISTCPWCKCAPTCNANTLLLLLENEAYGPQNLGFAELLERCRADFSSWATSNNVRHPQRGLPPKLVVRMESGAYMTCKGWNSQMVAEYLASRYLSIWKRDLPLPGRILCLSGQESF